MRILATQVFFEDISELLTEEELWDLEDYLIENPDAGDLIRGGKDYANSDGVKVAKESAVASVSFTTFEWVSIFSSLPCNANRGRKISLLSN